jgi:hypothetical protein
LDQENFAIEQGESAIQSRREGGMYEREESPPFQTQNVKRTKDGGLDQKVQEQEQEQEEAEEAEEKELGGVP